MKNLKTFEEFSDYWGTKKQPFWRCGVNPTVDILVIKDNSKILLIKRAETASCEQGKWVLPGGFHDTDSKKGEPWKTGKETDREAAIRELFEETGLIVSVDDLIKVGEYQKMGRHPFDNIEAWTKTTLFLVDLENNEQEAKGGDDASDAEWFTIEEVLNMNLAFDHNQLVRDGLKKLGLF